MPSPATTQKLRDVGLLLLRLGAGGMMMVHGWGKLSRFNEMASKFPDPLGIGSPASLTLAVFSEFFCALAIVLGFATRLAALPLIVTMIVAAFVIHGDDPFAKKELALLYLVAFAALAGTGAGKLSLDAKLWRR